MKLYYKTKQSESTDVRSQGRSSLPYYAIWTLCINECRDLVVKGFWIITKASGSLPASQSGHATTITDIFGHLLISEDPDRHPEFN